MEVVVDKVSLLHEFCSDWRLNPCSISSIPEQRNSISPSCGALPFSKWSTAEGFFETTPGLGWGYFTDAAPISARGTKNLSLQYFQLNVGYRAAFDVPGDSPLN
jgi:hypothetical protein